MYETYMILGVGVDIVDVNRIKEKIDSDSGFKDYVFSAHEIESCEKKSNRYASYAARFAAKEAFLKAIGTGIDFRFELHQLEVYNDEAGKPYFVYSPILEEQLSALPGGVPEIHLSMSHTSQQAIAFVVINKK